MVILSYEFALCFLLFFVVYWACRRSIQIQNYLLLGAGLLFVLSWQWQFLLSISYVWAIVQVYIHFHNRLTQQSSKGTILIFAVSALALHLCFFKYTNFTIGELNRNLPDSSISPLDIVMPLGISFYTFQAISYLVDIYRNKIKAVPASVTLAFLSFVPSITAGPIVRMSDAIKFWQPRNYQNYLPAQDMTESNVPQSMTRAERVAARQRHIILPYLAAALIIFALFKKIVLASWLETLWVNPVFANPLQFHGLEVLTAVYAYSLQLFFDFSGYTDLAIALALLLGFRLPENFNRPYLATDIQDFWNKWHMTLSTWIRDYIYIPLGGGRASFWRVQINIMLAFIISGVWHGAGWNFLIWGAIHGIALVFLNCMKKVGWRGWLTQKAKFLAVILTFHYVAFGWIFFRSASFEQAVQVLQGLTQFDGVMVTLSLVPTLAMMLLAWLVYPYLGRSREQLANLLAKLPWWSLPVIFALYITLVFSLAPEGLPGFIYANF
ncbi:MULTISPECIES: MBOAT family O-acyltransferase [unclassified Acinetobacter]|uniref:MBOAT family O-acyltransferase n=1 Tax=unclassified Acinetobacter TaxID=196816 RepID=UPI0035B6F49E